MTENYDIIVVGGGASGMAASITSAERGQRTLLLEKSDRLGRKILASGNGRCNLMNTGPLKYYGNAQFAKAVFNSCSIMDLSGFFRRYGLLIKEEKEGRVYPVTLKSVSVLDTLRNAMAINHVSVRLHTELKDVYKTNSSFICRTSEGKEYISERLIICTGGAAQKKLGGSYDGYEYLQSFGHHTEQVFPSLVPVVTDRKSISGLSGIRVRCGISLKKGEICLHKESGEVLFTDYGLSGICVMQCSRFISGHGLHFELDFFSSVFEDPDEALEEITGRRAKFAQFSPVVLLDGILLPKLSYAVLKQAGIALRGEQAGSLSDEDLKKIVWTAYRYRADVDSTKSFDEAQVTAGGVSCDEFDPRTMESRIVKGLFAAGEVLDVDGDCGGYNLMFAFASGLIAGGFISSSPSVQEESSS